MLLAGDIGGTKSLLGLFSAGSPRPVPQAVQSLVTRDHPSLESMVQGFLEAQRVPAGALAAACFGVAGAVTDQAAALTNVPWRISGSGLSAALGIGRVWLLNDLEALAYGVTKLTGDEVAVLQAGRPSPTGNAAVLAAGTGLGEAILLNVGGRLIPGASEGGHADFGARTPRELELVRELTRVFGRASVERVLSGPGIANLYQFTHDAFGVREAGGIRPARLCEAVGPVENVKDLPARVSAAAAAGGCDRCMEAIRMFVSAYGAEAGNIALRAVATGGVYIGGGIAPRILPALQRGEFMEAFLAKAPMTALVASMPVSVILRPDTALLGAAVHAHFLSAA